MGWIEQNQVLALPTGYKPNKKKNQTKTTLHIYRKIFM